MHLKKILVFVALTAAHNNLQLLHAGSASLLKEIPDGSDESGNDFSLAILGRNKAYANIDWSSCTFLEAFIGANIFFTDFSKTNFTGATFTTLLLHECTAPDALFIGASFSAVTAHECIFSNSSFVDFRIHRTLEPTGKSRFNRCRFVGCNFSRAHLSTAFILKSDYSGAHFKDAQVEETVFMETTLDNANFENAQLTEAQFIQTRLKNVNFKGTNLSSVFFTNCDLTGIQFDQTTKCEGSSYDQETEATMSESLKLFLQKNGASLEPS